MDRAIKNKMLLVDELVDKIQNLKKEGKVIVQSHGIFDLIHPGVVKHLNEAKKQGDVLIVTVIKDKNIKKGAGRPIFPENLRLENVASSELVDFACLVNDEKPFECVKKINPNIFAKGQAYKDRDHKIHEKIFEEEKELFFGKTKIHETNGFSFSSSQIINDFLDIYPKEVKAFLKEFSKLYSFDYIAEKINTLKGMKVLLIGDGIVDEYHYCQTMGKSPKAQLIVNKYINHEVFAGGAFAIANHIAGICDDVHLVTLLGEQDSREDFVLNSLKPNVTSKFFFKKDGTTVIKKRYLNEYRKQKIFEINFVNDDHIEDELEIEIINYLESVIKNYDLVLVSDFGHGFISKRIIKMVESMSKKLAVNAQTNGANAGYNLITKYSNPQFICLDAPEARLAAQEKHADIEKVAQILLKNMNTDYLFITVGSEGSLFINKKGTINRTPAFSTKVVDIIGAGDAFFSFTAPCFAAQIPMELVSFIGNSAGALAVQIMGNKKSIEKYELMEFIHTVLK
tara:strand:+ start:5907 stop:7439 length:1533 start_codon:yes stop_codon:yes gene_type:complete